jgi:hypothetical protein
VEGQQVSDTETETEEVETETTPEPDAPDPADVPDEDAEQDEEPEPIEGDERGQSDEQGGDEEMRRHENEARAQTEEALEKLNRQIENANRAHARKIAGIMGDDASALIPCPVCMDFVAGAIFPPEVAPIPAPVQERMKQLLGLNAWEDIPNAPWAQQCPDCKGHGEVKTGSTVLGKETTRCLNCGGDGWKNTRQGTNGTIEPSTVPAETGPGVYGLEVANDPDVQHLREKGYTVIPPMHVTGS